MTASGERNVITSADVMAAQNVIDAWVEAMTDRTDGTCVTQPAALELRGVLVATFADVRAAGYLEGVQEGRREAAAIVHNALEGEGL